MMSSLEERRRTAEAGVAGEQDGLPARGFLQPLAAGSGILAAAFIYGSHGWTQVAGWVLVFSAGFAWYTVLAMTLAAAFGRTVVPLFKYERKANLPGRRPAQPSQLEWAEPGVKQGQ